MASKGVKSALKAAKAAIQKKDYQDALQQCDFILKKDGTNYNALVFSGLCYSETSDLNQARNSYAAAIKSQPEQILAYQGLANLYTKHFEQKKTKDEIEESIEVYQKLLSMMDRNHGKKYIELCVTLCESYIESGKVEKALKLLDIEILELKESDDEFLFVLYDLVINVVKGDDKSSNLSLRLSYKDLITRSFQKLLNQPSASVQELMAIFDKYLEFLRSDDNLLFQNLPTLLHVCASLHERFPDQSQPLEILIQARIQNYNHPSITSINPICEKLNSIGGVFANIGLGFVSFTNQAYDKAEELLSCYMGQFEDFLPGWITLCETLLKLHKHKKAEKSARSGLMQYKMILNGQQSMWKLPVMSLEAARLKLSTFLAAALCGSHIQTEIMMGIETFRKIPLDDTFVLINMTKGLIRLERFEEASASVRKAMTQKPTDPDVQSWYLFTQYKCVNDKESISKLEGISPPSATSLFLLGKCMWEAGGEYRTEKRNCFTALVKAAKLDPHNPEIFLLLGHFYAKVQQDHGRAKGCYQKSYQLDPSDEEAASCLADIYVTTGDTDSATALYESITKEAGSGRCKWAWLRLGLCRLKVKDINTAIQCFLSALRMDADDAICWECLGEGYLQRGSYSAAWKAFNKAHEIDPNSVYSLYQMAKVKQVQGMFTDAIKEYEKVLEIVPDYIPALQGIGESELFLARHMMNTGRFQTGVDHCENAVGYLTKACSSRVDLCCLWKLLGDCCLLTYPLHGSIVQMNILSVLLDSKHHGLKTDSVTKVGRKELLSLASRFYCRAIHLQSENAALWHDLSVSYMKQTDAEEDEKENIELAQKSVNAMKKAIVLQPTNHVFWCSLGVLAASKYIQDPALSQHCFITSINHEQNNVQAWSNLATLYLEHGNVKKAHEAFKVAQSLEPSFVNSWIGQAIVAETIGSEETMDLYRHSTELGLHQQAASGYSSWVTQLMADQKNRSSSMFLDNIHNMNAVAMATVQMSKQCDRNPSCPWSSTVYGFLLEYSGLNRSAEKAYTRAHKALHCDNDEMAELTEKRNKAAANLARILCKNGKYDESISTYLLISPLNGFREICGLSLSYHKSGQPEKAIEAYEQAGKLASTDNEKALVMVAMAMTFFTMGKADEAKTLLYRCFQNCKDGLQSLCALGIVLKDQALVGAAVGEILKNKSLNHEAEDVMDDCLLISAAAELCDDPNLALKEVQKALHQNPSSWSLRTHLCRLLVTLRGLHGVRSVPLLSSQASKLYSADHLANPLDRDSEFWRSTNRHKNQVTVSQSEAISSLAGGEVGVRLGRKLTERLRKAQTFVHMHPYESSSWASMACASHADNVENWFEGGTLTESNVVGTSAERSLHNSASSDDLKRWASNISTWSQILRNREIDPQSNADAEFIQSLQKVSMLEDRSSVFSTQMRDIISQIPKTSDPKVYAKYLGEFAVKMGRCDVAKLMFEKAVKMDASNHLQVAMLLFRNLHVAVTLLLDSKGEHDEWHDVMKNTSAELLKFDSNSLISKLFQALVLRIEKNPRKSKVFLNRVINSTDCVSDVNKSVAIWYLYRTLHERNDSMAIEALVSKAEDLKDEHLSRLQQLLPTS